MPLFWMGVRLVCGVLVVPPPLKPDAPFGAGLGVKESCPMTELEKDSVRRIDNRKTET